MSPYLIIIRPLNVGITFVSVVVVLFLAHGDAAAAWRPSLLAALSAALVCAGANVINDLFDVDIDRVNKPNRPLVTGSLSLRSARIWWLLLSAVGVTFSIPLGWHCVVIAGLAVIGLYGYSWRLKSTPLWGNLTVSFFTALAFLYGGLAIGKVDHALWPAVFAFLFHFGREILKDVEDMTGDAQQGARTFPLVYGRRTALALTSIVFLAVALTTATAYAVGSYSEVFLSIVLCGVYPVLLYVGVSMWTNPESGNLGRLNGLLKADMLVGIIAMLAG